MNSGNGTVIKFVAVVLLLCEFVSGDVEVRCIQKEREALLSFKNGLIDEYEILSTWRSDECCKWYGVGCSNTTGRVISLKLNAFDFDGALRGKVTSSLLELHHLTYLDLSSNDFGGDRIPEFFGSMKQLQHLYLFNSNLAGIVPPNIGNLTNLRSLALSGNSLRTENLDWLSTLSLLSLLDLSQFDLSQTNWPQSILSLPSLQILYLKACNIKDVKPSHADLFVNYSSTSLSILDLSDNYFTPAVYDWLSTSLVKIDLSYNALGGLIPNAFDRLGFLEHLDLSGNMLAGEIPKSLGNRPHLRVLVLCNNRLSGDLDGLLGNKSANQLEILDLYSNQLKGPVPDLGAFSALTKLYLGSNAFTGSVPSSLGQLSKLRILDLSNNNLKGTVNESESLEVLDFSINSLVIRIAPDWTPPFQSQKIILAGCIVGPTFPRWIQSQTSLRSLDLSGAGIIDEVPKWLWNLSSSMAYLLLSDNQISGVLPDLSSTPIPVIDVSSNNISGPIPLFNPNTEALQLSHNRMSGPLSFLCNTAHDSLYFIDLSNNQLSGEVPDCWEKTPYLNYLNLANNSFSGEIPHSLGSLHDLTTLQLGGTNLSGELPSALRFCRRLSLIDVGGNELTGNIPAWMGESYADLEILNFHSNRFYGSIPFEICNLTKIRILDISRNNLSGEIPDCFNIFTTLTQRNTMNADFYLGYTSMHDSHFPYTNLDNVFTNYYSTVQWKGQESEYRNNLFILTLIDFSSNRLIGNIPQSFANMRELISLNLSRNGLTGNIIPDIGKMEMLESLDLSNNKLSSQIPKSLENLRFLGVLDLSNNNLWGKIPSSTQLQSFNTSSYAGNNGLCGNPMELCPGDRLKPPTTTDGDGEKDEGWCRLCKDLSYQWPWVVLLDFGALLVL